jgi:hypothetical protein
MTRSTSAPVIRALPRPSEPDVQIALIPVLLQLIHDLDQIVLDIGAKIPEQARRHLFLPAGELLIAHHRKRVRCILDRASPG